LRSSVAPPQQTHANLGEQVRREAREGGITLTEEQLNDRIQTIVKQVMTEQAKAEGKSVVEIMPIASSTSATIESVSDPVKETSARGGNTVAVDLSSLTDEEIRSRAKVLTNLARQHHDK
jgi:4-alpha-glucanotransferase